MKSADKIVLLKDVVIPAGTILSTAPTKTERYGSNHYEAIVGLTKDSSGTFTYCIDDEKLADWFTTIKE